MTDTDRTNAIADLEADNRRLRRLLDQHDAPGELRHRLNSTLAMLRIIIRKSAETNRDLDAYAGHLEDRLDAVMRAQAAADEAGVVDLGDLFAAELLHYGAKEGEQVTLAGPKISLRPRAGQVMALAIHELAVNAVEHGALGGGAGEITVTWKIEAADPDPVVLIVWKETGSAVVEAGRQGFGTEVLTHTIGYELRATTSLDFEPDGLRCTLRFPLTDRVGEAEAR